MIEIDGSMGEGGGQVLRSSLALSLVTERPFHMTRIRAGRERPGLMKQHLTAVRAAAEVGQAEAVGAEIGSQEIRFTPRPARPGRYRFDVGSAGSCMLVFQTVFPALMTLDGPSELLLEGGTHNPFAPPFDFLARAFLPLMERIGVKTEARLARHGFYPAGGGRAEFRVTPAPAPARLELMDRGEAIAQRVEAIVSNLPLSIAERETKVALHKLGWPGDCAQAREVAASGPGNAVMIEIRFARVTEVFTGFGEKGMPAEKVAAAVAKEAKAFLGSEAVVGEHMADQLLLPMALAKGGAYLTTAPSSHTTTNAEVIRAFLDIPITMTGESGGLWRVEVGR